MSYPLLGLTKDQGLNYNIRTQWMNMAVMPIRLGPRVKNFKNGYPESSKDNYSINLKKYIWCIRNHCIASFSELHNATRANKVWWPMCVICMHAFNTNTIISATRHQIEIKLPFRNDNVFVLKVLSISFNFKELFL